MLTAWTRKGEVSKLWSLIAGRIATVRPLGSLWRADVFGPRGSSSHTWDCQYAARQWAEMRYKGEVMKPDPVKWDSRYT